MQMYCTVVSQCREGRETASQTIENVPLGFPSPFTVSSSPHLQCREAGHGERRVSAEMEDGKSSMQHHA
jgi:hypothetical protein